MRGIVIALILVVVAIVFANAYVSFAPAHAHFISAKVQKMDITDTVAVTGQAEPTAIWLVQPEVPGGVVEKVLVNFNDPVKEGQILVITSSRIQEINLEKAKLDLGRAQSAVNRATSLIETAQAGLVAANAEFDAAKRRYLTAEESVRNKLIPESAADNLNDFVKKAEAGVEEARSRIAQAQAGKIEAESQAKAAQIAVDLAEYYLDKTKLRSKWNGIVLNKDIHEGDVLGRPQLSLMDSQSPSAPLQIAAPLDHMQAIVKVSEADYSRVKVGQKATFRIDAYPDELFDATVVEIRDSPTSDRTAVSYATVLKFANKKDPETGQWMIKPRSTVTADIIVRRVDGALAVPSSAFYYTPPGIDVPPIGPGQKVVWKRGDDGNPVGVVITIGVSDGTYTQVVSGDLIEGDTLVVGRPREEQKKGFMIPIAN